MTLSRRTQLSIAAAVAGLLVVAVLLRYLPRSTPDARAIGPALVAVDSPQPAHLPGDAQLAALTEVPEDAEVAPEQRADPAPVVLRNAPRVPPRTQEEPSDPTPPPKYVLIGQLVDESGGPATEPVHVHIRSPNGAGFGLGRLDVNPDGSFGWEVGEIPHYDDYHVHLRTNHTLTEPIRHILREGTNDLGRIVMVPMPLVVAGSVVDPDRTPAVGASVVVHQDFAIDPNVYGDELSSNTFPTAHTDEAGRFTIRSTRRCASLSVQVRDGRGRVTSVATHYGDENCRVVMPESMTRVEFVVKLPPAAPRMPFLTAVLLKDGSADGSAARSIVHPGEKVVFSAVEPGEYSLRLSGGWLFDDVELDAKVEVRPSLGNAPQMLGPYDISSQLGEVRLTVTNPEAMGIAARSGSRNLKAGTTLHV